MYCRVIYGHHWSSWWCSQMIKTGKKNSSWSWKVWKAGSFVEKLLWLVSLLRGAPRHLHRKTPHQIDAGLTGWLLCRFAVSFSLSAHLLPSKPCEGLSSPDLENNDHLEYKSLLSSDWCTDIFIYSGKWLWWFSMVDQEYKETDCKNIHQCEYETLHYHHPPWTSPKRESGSTWISGAIVAGTAPSSLSSRHRRHFEPPKWPVGSNRRHLFRALTHKPEHSRTHQRKQSCIQCPKAPHKTGIQMHIVSLQLMDVILLRHITKINHT